MVQVHGLQLIASIKALSILATFAYAAMPDASQPSPPPYRSLKLLLTLRQRI